MREFSPLMHAIAGIDASPPESIKGYAGRVAQALGLPLRLSPHAFSDHPELWQVLDYDLEHLLVSLADKRPASQATGVPHTSC